MDSIKNKILENAHSLQKLGIDDLAWKRKDATSLILSLMNENIGILGGDVYLVESSGKIIPLSENWSSILRDNENKKDFYIRSKLESLSYIEKFPIEPEEKILFSLVFIGEVDLGNGGDSPRTSDRTHHA